LSIASDVGNTLATWKYIMGHNTYGTAYEHELTRPTHGTKATAYETSRHVVLSLSVAIELLITCTVRKYDILLSSLQM
jgi:hypothetical protein